MSQVSRAASKLKFQTGDVPSQGDYTDLHDSVTWYDEKTVHQYRKVDANNDFILPTDYVLSVNNGNSNWTITLPDAALYPGKVYIIKRYDQNSTNSIQIESAGGDVQDTNGTFVGISVLGALFHQFGSQRMFMSNGANWEYIL